MYKDIHKNSPMLVWLGLKKKLQNLINTEDP